MWRARESWHFPFRNKSRAKGQKGKPPRRATVWKDKVNKTKVETETASADASEESGACHGHRVDTVIDDASLRRGLGSLSRHASLHSLDSPLSSRLPAMIEPVLAETYGIRRFFPVLICYPPDLRSRESRQPAVTPHTADTHPPYENQVLGMHANLQVSTSTFLYTRQDRRPHCHVYVLSMLAWRRE